MPILSRRVSIAVPVGPVTIGGDAPIVVQSMTNTDTADVEATVQQVAQLARAGSELSCFTSYDFLVINDEVERAYQELRAIYVAARCAQLRRAPFARVLAAQLEPPSAG